MCSRCPQPGLQWRQRDAVFSLLVTAVLLAALPMCLTHARPLVSAQFGEILGNYLQRMQYRHQRVAMLHTAPRPRHRTQR
ncbi:hypothetical protein PSCLAVI8L_440030 [Pseudoclavibacter sp. 8L]|nr:hypothetical protein PSCLAVI8L_440030 [Pseudoclavibacter sp. 8L]